MSVRRLAPDSVQPASFAFTPENEAWARAQIGKYPPGRQQSAVIPVLWRAQEQCGGWLPRAAVERVAAMLDMAVIRVLEVATFYTQFQLQPVGAVAHVQVCGTTPCMLCGAEDIIAVCKADIAPHAFELSPDGRFSWEEVECLGACVNAPMVLIGKDTYEDLTPESFRAVLQALARGERPRPGPQIDRQFSAPVGERTSLTDPALYEAPPPRDFEPPIITIMETVEAAAAEAAEAAAKMPEPERVAGELAAEEQGAGTGALKVGLEAAAGGAAGSVAAAADASAAAAAVSQAQAIPGVAPPPTLDAGEAAPSQAGDAMRELSPELASEDHIMPPRREPEMVEPADPPSGPEVVPGRATPEQRDMSVPELSSAPEAEAPVAAPDLAAAALPAEAEPPVAQAGPAESPKAVAAREEAEIAAVLKALPKGATAEHKADAVGTRPPGLDGPRGGQADNLQLIRGIAKGNEAKLNRLGIFHFDQIAAWTRPEIRWVGTYLGFPGRIDREHWTAQAAALAEGGIAEYERRFGRKPK